MTIQSATPESGSIIQRGEIITVVWDQTVSGGPPTVIYEPGGGNPNEEVYVGGFPAFQPGYTGSRVFDTPNNTWVLSFKRNAGWGGSSFGIAAYYQLVRNDLTYTILAEGQYPPDMQPFNDPAAQVGTGEVLIQDSGVAKGSATTLNLADYLHASVSGGTATIHGEAGGGNAIAVYNDTELLTSTLFELKFSDGTDAVRGASPGSIVVTATGGDGGTGSGGQEVVANVTTNGGGDADVSANSVGIAEVTVTTTQVICNFTSPFSDTDYFVQITPLFAPLQYVLSQTVAKTTGACVIKFFYPDDVDGTVDPSQNVINFDLTVQSSAAGSGAGDVTSSETAGTVQNGELTVFDGTSGKLIKGAGTGVYSANGSVNANWIFGQSGVSTGGTINISSPTAVLDMNEYVTGAPTEIAGAGRWWVRNETGAANTPMFTDGAGTEYDLTSGTAGTVDTVVGGTGISVNSADSANPIVSTDDGAIVHDSLSGFVAAEHLDWSSDLGGTQIHASNYTSGSGITSWNGQSGPVVSIYVQAADPDITITPNPGDVWIEIP